MMTPAGRPGVINDATTIYFLGATLPAAFVARRCRFEGRVPGSARKMDCGGNLDPGTPPRQRRPAGRRFHQPRLRVTAAQAILKNPGWRCFSMAKLVYGLNQSLDGYVDHQRFAPGHELFRHFTEQVRDLTGSVYGRRMYEVMRYWDEDRPEWGAAERDFAVAWRKQPKWVVSRSLASVGPNAILVEDDVEAVIRGLKAQLVGEIEVGGPDLARSLTDLGLIDEYRLYFHPVVLGRGKPFFAGPRPPLRLVASNLIGEDAIRLTYVPA
jgi:dihydrofolate reductase